MLSEVTKLAISGIICTQLFSLEGMEKLLEGTLC